jgi:hypothetical protein
MHRRRDAAARGQAAEHNPHSKTRRIHISPIRTPRPFGSPPR